MKVLFLEFRGFGDAIIKSGFIERVIDENIVIDVITSPSRFQLFKMNNRIRNVFACEYPSRFFKPKNLGLSIKNLRLIQKEKYDICIDTSADFREILIGKLCCSKKLITVKRIGFNFGRTGLGFLADERINITIENKNVYKMFQYIFKKIQFHIKPQILPQNVLDKKCIGIHPFASSKSRMWSWENWRELIKKLLAKKYKIIVFSSPNEEKELRYNLGKVISKPNVKVSVGSLADFLIDIKKTDIMIGLDSFSVHAAYYAGVKSIVLYGNNVDWWEMWTPPFAEPLSTISKCSDCTRKCQNIREKDINSITTQTVLNKIFAYYQNNKI